MFQKLTAKVQINSTTKEIKEYELQEGEAAQTSFFKSKGLMFLVVETSIAVAVAPLLAYYKLENLSEKSLNYVFSWLT